MTNNLKLVSAILSHSSPDVPVCLSQGQAVGAAKGEKNMRKKHEMRCKGKERKEKQKKLKKQKRRQMLPL